MVMVEDTRFGEAGQVAILEAATTGQHLRYAGEDVTPGTLVLTAGTRIRSAEIAMLATMGRAQVTTYRLPRVAVISTGDEVVEIEAGCRASAGVKSATATAMRWRRWYWKRERSSTPCCIFPTNRRRPSGAANLRRSGRWSGRDRYGGRGFGGGSGFRQAGAERLGTLDLWRVAMKPGKAAGLWEHRENLVFWTAGNPVSAMVHL